MIAYHYPPVQGSSGVQRTLRFSQYLQAEGWEPLVLTVHPRAYQSTDATQSPADNSDLVIQRAFALDAARHLAVRGAYPRLLALPDRWATWWFGAIPAGLRLIQKHRPAVIWSTYPIATAHLIALTLHKMVRIPWIADFRDSMTEDNYPRDPTTRRVYRWIERHAVSRCSQAVFTTPGALRMYADRYPAVPMTKWKMIANGFDEVVFRTAEANLRPKGHRNSQTVLVHSGVLYPAERDPRKFFLALKDLLLSGKISPSNLRIILRGSGHEDHYQRLIDEYGIGDIVHLAPQISYHDALTEMLQAGGLLVFQASSCNHQIPAKVYEYVRSQRPIFALTDPVGDTAELLRTLGIDTIVPLDSKDQIAEGLLEFLERARKNCAPIASPKEITRYSRKVQANELATLLDSLISADK